MDFIEDLPKSFAKEVIWVVVDRFSNACFVALEHPFLVKDVSQAYVDHIFKITWYAKKHSQ